MALPKRQQNPVPGCHHIGILILFAWLAAPVWSQALIPDSSPGVPPQLVWESPEHRPRVSEDLSDPSKRPRPPFRFVEEDLGGTNPKIKVRDANERLWIVKWSEEIHGETFASNLAGALGYFVRPTFYLREGTIKGARNLGRAGPYVARDGSFRNAALKLISAEMPYLAGINWSWINNPFLEAQEGRRELNGLKIVVMLTSNWDAKDARDVDRGPNTAVYRTTGKGQTVRFLYALDDWGASMGRWGNVLTRQKWDCDGYAAQTPDFVAGVEDGFVKWGYVGRNSHDVTEGIKVEDVRWLLNPLAKITDHQLEAALRSSGADEDEVLCFHRAIRERIRQLQRVADQTLP